MTSDNPFDIYKLFYLLTYIHGPLYNPNYQIYLIVICENILKIIIIWQNELFNGKELKAKHIICVDLFNSNAGKNVIHNFS